MKYLFLLLLTWSVGSHAQRSLTPQVFQVNVRPVLNGILNDFYQMISLFPDFPKNIVNLLEKVEVMELEKEILKEKCPRVINRDCLDTVLSIQSKLAAIQAGTLEVMSQQKMSYSLTMTNIGGMRLINEFQANLEEIKGEIDNSAFMLKAEVAHKKETYYVIKKLGELSTILSLTVVEFIPFPYKDDFRHFYFNFVHPIQQQISRQKNYEFLNRNVNSLNFALNLLNMNLTKRNKKTPEGMGPYLSLIHSRWNSILRYYM